MNRFEYLGTTDEHTACECCGKVDLKRTVAIRDLDSGADRFFGTACAARALRVQIAEVRKGTEAADKARRETAERTRRAAADARAQVERAAFRAWVVAKTGDAAMFDRLDNIDSDKCSAHFGAHPFKVWQTWKAAA